MKATATMIFQQAGPYCMQQWQNNYSLFELMDAWRSLNYVIHSLAKDQYYQRKMREAT